MKGRKTGDGGDLQKRVPAVFCLVPDVVALPRFWCSCAGRYALTPSFGADILKKKKVEGRQDITKEYTTEELTGRWEALREIRNLMGRMSQETLYRGEARFFDLFWSTQRQDVCLGVNEGWYLGADSIRRFYDAAAARTALSDRVLRRRFPKQAKEGFGLGQMDLKPLSSDIVEVAGDGQTAKGLWAVQGSDCRFGAEGPLSYWTIGVYAADFCLENGAWKLWHLLDLKDVDCPSGECWWLPRRDRPAEPGFEELADTKLPAPDAAAPLHMLWTPGRVGGRMPECPQPYEHFSDTFTYGYEEVR